MRSKLLGLFVALSLLLGVLTPALADDTIVATFDNTVNPVENYTVEDLNSHRSISGGILTLKDDVTLNLVTTESVSAGQNGYVGFVLEYGHIDLNGHTLTFVLPEITTSPDVIWGIYCIENSTVKNGTIKIDAASSTGAKFNAVIMVYGAINPQFGMPDVNNVEFVSGNASSETAVNFMLGQTTPMVIKNCVVGSGFDTAVGTQLPSGYDDSANGSVTVITGSYRNLDSSNNRIEISEESTKLTTLPGEVDENTTVIVSDDTTAIIVDDGNAYLYDTLQDAVDAVGSGGTIQLLKQPEDERVVVPDDSKFSISAFGENVDTSKLPLETSDGKKVVVGTGGTVEVVDIPAESITLDKTSVEVFSGETVTLTATVEPIDTTDTVTWSTSDAAVATVNADGVVTGVSQGTAIITAKAGNVSATCTVTVDPTWKVMLDNELKEVLKGDPFTFPAAPTKPGYIFMGWRGVDGVTYQPGDKVSITGDASFKAIWANMPDITPGTPDEPDEDVFPFYDVAAGAWYYDAVKYVWENGIMNGTGATEFSPNTTLNRAMIWTMLARIDGVSTDGGANWYAKAQEWAMAEGVSDGTDPMGAVTREQLVTMLWRFKGEPTVDFLLTAKDADTVSSWAYEAMRWAVAEGIIEGDENGLITPTATATRAQAAAIFMRFIEG